MASVTQTRGSPVTAAISDASVIRADPDVVACELGGGAALLDLRTSTYYSLNPVGSRVWDLVQEPASFTAIREAITAAYDVDVATCHADLVALLGRLSEAGLVKIADAAPAS